MTDERSSNGFGKGLLIGGLMGAAIALMYAPKSGIELRQDVRKKADGIKDGFTRYARNLRKKGNGILEKAEETAEAAASLAHTIAENQ